jgi:hypothetical protein
MKKEDPNEKDIPSIRRENCTAEKENECRGDAVVPESKENECHGDAVVPESREKQKALRANIDHRRAVGQANVDNTMSGFEKSFQQLAISEQTLECPDALPTATGRSTGLGQRPDRSALLPKAQSGTPTANPQIRTHPAVLTPAALSYLSPLLALKAVSPTIETFGAWLSERTPHLAISKIGEGSFGEVYRATTTTSPSHPSGPKTPTSVILKLIPLAPATGPGSKSFTPISAAATEVQLLQHMQRVPGFVEFRGACVLQGPMPEALVAQWEAYVAKGRSVQSRDPRRKGAYPKGQLWLVVEMSDAGRSLERGDYFPGGARPGRLGDSERYLSVHRTWDIFWQVVRALAKAEVYAAFEHRDLHLGNICAADPPSDMEEDAEDLEPDDGSPFELDTSGVRVTIIDYSLSRADVGEKVLAYDFLADKALVKGEGELQYDVYRYAAAAIKMKGESGAFVPRTNVLWCWYILVQLLAYTKNLSAQATSDSRVARMRLVLEGLVDGLGPEADRVGCAGHLLEMGALEGWFCAEAVLAR